MLAVIDTNVLLVSVSSRSKYHWLYNVIIEKKINIAFSNEILTEYEEKIASHWNFEVATSVVRSLLELSTAKLSVIYFNLKLITKDEDNNKFADCAFSANADFLVTNDHHFDVLKNIDFPSIRVINIIEFKDILIKEGIIQWSC